MRKDKHRLYQGQHKNILVQNGIDVKKQILGSGRGEYFSGNLNAYDTGIINGHSSMAWRISFRNLVSGEVFKLCVQRQMWIGRLPATEPGQVRLVLNNDLKISKNHCVIYEEEETGRLCLSDYQSKNHTYVNGRKIKAPVYLNTGDIIQAGDTRLEVEFGK